MTKTYFVDADFLIQGFDEDKVNPVSVDLTIHKYRRLKQVWRNVLCRPFEGKLALDKKEKELGYRPDIFNSEHQDVFWARSFNIAEGDEIELLGYEPVLFSSNEYLDIPKSCLGILLSKSSFGRALQEHLHAGLFDPGFSGVATFEIINMAPFPVTYRFEQKIVQLIILVGERPNKAYAGRYQHQINPQPIRKEV